MGGDNAPVSEVAGAIETISTHPAINIILVGIKEKIEPELSKFSYDKSRIKIHHASEIIEMHESPAEAIRKKTDSSIIS